MFRPGFLLPLCAALFAAMASVAADAPAPGASAVPDDDAPSSRPSNRSEGMPLAHRARKAQHDLLAPASGVRTSQRPASAASSAMAALLNTTLQPLQAPHVPAGCPQTDASWNDWRTQAIDRLLLPRLVDDDERVSPDDQADQEDLYVAQVAGQAATVKNTLDFCDAGPNGGPGLRHAASVNLWNFAATQANVADVLHEFGHGGADPLALDDFSYIARVREYVDLPAELKSTEFLDAVSSERTYARAYGLVQEHNRKSAEAARAGLPADPPWLAVVFKSQFLTTPDHAATHGRFLVVAPGAHFDRWVQFGIHAPDDYPKETVNNVSVVAVSHRNPGDPKFDALIDWWRIYTADHTIRLETRRESQGITGNCLECHKALPLGIHPAES